MPGFEDLLAAAAGVAGDTMLQFKLEDENVEMGIEDEEVGEEKVDEDNKDDDLDLKADAEGSSQQKSASQQKKWNRFFINFADIFLGGDKVAAAEVVTEFKKQPKAMHYDILRPYIKLGMSQIMTRIVFSVGSNCWTIAKGEGGPKKRGGLRIRGNAVSPEQLEQLKRMFDPENQDALPLVVEIACADVCAGKRALTAKTWADVYAHYVQFEPKSLLPKMMINTFYKYARATELDFCLQSSKKTKKVGKAPAKDQAHPAVVLGKPETTAVGKNQAVEAR